MKNILLISFALLFVGGCSESSNPVADDTSSVKCTESGCSATGCAADCACGCDGVSGADGCTCATNCACANEDEDDDSSTANAISIANGAFNPSILTISIGDTVTWTLTNGTHTVVSDDGLFTSGSISSGGTFQHTFDTAGTFTYKCGIHSAMTGTIIVQ